MEEDEDVEDEERSVDIDAASMERSGSEKSRRSVTSAAVQSPTSPPPTANPEDRPEGEDKFDSAGKDSVSRTSSAKITPQPNIPKGPDNQTLLRLLEEGEELHSMFRCARIQGLDTCEGLLLFGKEQ